MAPETPEAPRRAKRPLQALPVPPAYQAAPASRAVVAAIQALRNGKANEYQQKLALEWIVADACGKRHFPYHPSDRDTTLALGRYFVAEQINGLLNVDLATLRRD